MSEVEKAWCVLHLSARPGVPVVGGLVAESADLLGLGPSERSRLRTLVQEVVESIVADSFEGAAEIDLDVSVRRRPGGLAIVIEDRGAPSKLVQGNYPPRIADLIRLGFADEVSVHGEGIAGNRTEIRKVLAYPSVAEDPAFAAGAAAPVEEILLDEQGIPVLDIRPMVDTDVLEVARLFYRVYGYSLVQSSIVYEPERLAEHVRAGSHLATVAVTPSGRIIGHLASEVTEPGLRSGRIGLLAVEPAYRRHHISTMLGYAQYERLLELGIVGQFTEAVTVHPRSQAVALKAGAREVGLILAGQHSGMDFQGFEGLEGARHAAMIMYGMTGPNPQRTVYVPAAYAELARTIYRAGKLPRTVAVRDARPPRDLPESSRFKVVLSHESGVARLTVESYGADFDAALLSQLNELRLNRFDLIMVYLPLADPLTGFFGNGLAELGLSFTGLYPEFQRDGDVLVVQMLNNVEFDRSAIIAASPLGEQLRDFVLADFDKAQDRSARLLRSRAQMARFYEALE